MGKVKKKGGRMQPFLPPKIKRGIVRAAKDAGLTPKQVTKLVLEVAEPVIETYKRRKSFRASELRRSILGRIERRSKKTAIAWRRFERKMRS